MELLLMVSAAKRAGAASVNVITPYFGYARMDRRFGNKAVPVSAGDVVQMLTSLGVNTLSTIDIHCKQI
jgi:ribose-phosphate pyrophosphokinase